MVATVPVVIRGEKEPLLVELYHPKAKPQVDAPIARCTVPCRAMVPAGRYKLYVHETEGTVDGSRTIDISQPVTLTVGPKGYGQRVGGLVLALTGSTMLISGIVLAAVITCVEDGSSRSCGTDSQETAAVALVLGGLVATPVGWIMFGNSLRPGLTQTAPQYGVAPTLFPSRATGANDHLPGLVFNGRF
jgi:hypothetical protein